jgi:hypothetical protein
MWLRTSLLSLSIFTTIAVGSHQALAETEAAVRFGERMKGVIEDLSISCRSERANFCAKVTPGKGRFLMCALAHEDQLSANCKGAVFDAMAELGEIVNNLQFAVSNCKADIESKCKDVDPGQGRIAQCLINQKASLSEGCQEAVSKFEKHN